MQLVVMAGGKGTRLWPLSRESFPKQFIKIINDRSLFQETLLRHNFIQTTPIIITNKEYKYIVQDQLKEIDVKAEIILEPIPRNTATCAILAATIAKQKKQKSVILVSSDHYISSPDQEYSESIISAEKISHSRNVITIGIKPTFPSTGYGYIKTNNSKEGEALLVDCFVEKPELSFAQKYYYNISYWWNTGIFVFDTEIFLHMSQSLYYEDYNLIQNAYSYADYSNSFCTLNKEYFEKIKLDSIDYAFMEKIKNIALIPAKFQWSDVGSWNAMKDISEVDYFGNHVSGNVELFGTKNCIVHNTNDRLIVAGQIQDTIIVNTDDAVLILPESDHQEVKSIVESLKNKNIKQASQNNIVYRPWGYYSVITLSEMYQVKKITVLPGRKLSLQYHKYRSEHWVIVQGVAEVQIGEKILELYENDSTYIPKGMKHRLTNIGERLLQIIEVQTGHYLGEDDIIRLKDEYGR